MASNTIENHVFNFIDEDGDEQDYNYLDILEDIQVGKIN
jgi:hypothetical protein